MQREREHRTSTRRRTRTCSTYRGERVQQVVRRLKRGRRTGLQPLQDVDEKPVNVLFA